MNEFVNLINTWISNDSKGSAHFAWNDASETEITTACGKVILLENAKLVIGVGDLKKIPRCKRCVKSISDNRNVK